MPITPEEAAALAQLAAALTAALAPFAEAAAARFDPGTGALDEGPP